MSPYSKKYHTKHQPQENTLSKLPLPGGLPNIGNICFLNSILQQLYQLEKLREQLINGIEQYENASLLGSICRLFVSMKNKDQIKSNEKFLRKIQAKLPQILLDYEINSQFDSFQTIVAIMNEIFEHNPDLQNLFRIQYTLSCRCTSQMSLSEFTLEEQTKICSRCQQKLTRKILKFPIYLLCQGANTELFEENFEESNQKSTKVRLLSKNIYIGNKESGHYYSICYINEKAYQFNDETTTEYQESKVKKQEKCVFAIYQVIEDRKPKALIQRTNAYNKNRTKKIKPATKDIFGQDIFKYVNVDNSDSDKFKNDQRISKESFISKRPAKQIAQIQKPFLSIQCRFTIFVLFANYFHKIFNQLSKRLKISINSYYSFPTLPQLPRFMNFARKLRIFSSLRNIFLQKAKFEERQIPMLLT